MIKIEAVIEKNIQIIKELCNKLNFRFEIKENECFVFSSLDVDCWRFRIDHPENIILYHRDKKCRKTQSFHKQKLCNNVVHILKYIKQHDAKYLKFGKKRRKEPWDIFLKLKNY